MRILLAGGMLSVALVLGGADAPSEPAPAPPPAAARDAMQKYDAAAKQAEEVYAKAMIEAKKACVKDLETPLKTVMREGNIQDAKAIDEIRTQMQGEIRDIETGEKILQLNINPAAALFVRKWKPVTVNADGTLINVDGRKGGWRVDGDTISIRWANGMLETAHLEPFTTYEGDKHAHWERN